jgi:hypothetical protein
VEGDSGTALAWSCLAVGGPVGGGPLSAGRRLGFDQHFLAADSLRAVAGVALSMTAAPTAGAAPEARWRRGASRRKGRDRWREITLRRAMPSAGPPRTLAAGI